MGYAIRILCLKHFRQLYQVVAYCNDGCQNEFIMYLTLLLLLLLLLCIFYTTYKNILVKFLYTKMYVLTTCIFTYSHLHLHLHFTLLHTWTHMMFVIVCVARALLYMNSLFSRWYSFTLSAIVYTHPTTTTHCLSVTHNKFILTKSMLWLRIWRKRPSKKKKCVDKKNLRCIEYKMKK